MGIRVPARRSIREVVQCCWLAWHNIKPSHIQHRPITQRATFLILLDGAMGISEPRVRISRLSGSRGLWKHRLQYHKSPMNQQNWTFRIHSVSGYLPPCPRIPPPTFPQLPFWRTISSHDTFPGVRTNLHLRNSDSVLLRFGRLPQSSCPHRPTARQFHAERWRRWIARSLPSVRQRHHHRAPSRRIAPGYFFSYPPAAPNESQVHGLEEGLVCPERGHLCQDL